MLDHAWAKAQRILLVRLDNLGDVLVTTPAFRAIRNAFPAARLSLLASPIGAQAGRLNRDLDEVIVYEAPWMDPWSELPHDPVREQQMIAELRHRRFDAAIIFTSFRQSSLPAAYLCYLAAIPLRCAASIDGSGSLLTTRHKHPVKMMHEVERGLDLVGSIGVAPAERELVLDVPDDALERATAFLDASRAYPNQPVAVVHPGCSMPARTYPAELYADVCDLLADRLGALVLLTGSESERERTSWIQSRCGWTPVNLAGTLEFPEFAATIQCADVAVTNNTGPMHVAAATGTPVVALFALTNPPEQWGPWMAPHRQLYVEVSCRLCYSRICPYNQECLRGVSPPMVVDAVEELLEAQDQRPSSLLAREEVAS